MVKVVLRNAVVLLRCEPLVERVLGDEHHSLVVQPLDDLVTHSRLSGCRPSSDTCQKSGQLSGECGAGPKSEKVLGQLLDDFSCTVDSIPPATHF
jgi:hypothetical protein